MNEQGTLPESEGQKIEKRDIYTLRAYPERGLYSPPGAATDIDELVADILAHGLRTPIEILPDGTVINVHLRRSALIRLVQQGRTQYQDAQVLVHRDLAGKGPDAIRKRFIEGIITSRVLTPEVLAKLRRAIAGN